jgi:transketolase C-terminal domain/subunit
MVGVNDRFGESGETGDLMLHIGINSESIENAVRKVLKRK